MKLNKKKDGKKKDDKKKGTDLINFDSSEFSDTSVKYRNYAKNLPLNLFLYFKCSHGI